MEEGETEIGKEGEKRAGIEETGRREEERGSKRFLDKSTESILSSVAFSEVKLLSIYLCTLQPTLNNIDKKTWVGNF